MSEEDQEEHEKDLYRNQSRQLNSRATDEISCNEMQYTSKETETPLYSGAINNFNQVIKGNEISQ